MKVHPSQTGEVAAAQTGAAAAQLATAKTSGAHFASLLASTTETSKADSPIKPKTGEAMSAVKGHAYAEISGGKRDGLYVNTSGNSRRGQAFVLVHKHGREFHIYGTGKDRVVVALRKPAATDRTETTSAANTTTGGVGQTTPTVSAS
jgi:hypothetical protein